MDDATRERMKALLTELHAAEYHSDEYYRIVEQLEAVVEPERLADEPVEVVELGEVTHYAFESEEAARRFRRHAELLGAAVIDEALFDSAARAEDDFWYVTISHVAES